MGVIETALAAQGTIKPGTDGWWQVFGARAQDIHPGDMVLIKDADNNFAEYQVQALTPRGEGHLMDVVRPRFLATDGTHFTVGALQACSVLRRGTHHILADSI
jgi:hypothetical protein